MKIITFQWLVPVFVIAVFCSFTSPEVQQKDALDLTGTNTTDRISRGQLAAYKQVRAGFGEDFAFDGLKLKVTSYTFVHAPKNGNAFIESVNGNTFTPSIKARLLQVKPGDMVIISAVNVKGDGWDYKRIINGKVFTVY